ncbi:hypothetical protein [Sphingobacterium sp. MYb382]|uniref:hypothetical protein n=1 Tax=Sphingobacterium sp. MYb382 TaxID=2745278 RepID=UPI0030B3A3C2
MIISTFILLLTSIIGACTTYFVNVKLGQGPVRSSALLTLLVAGFFHLFPHLLSPHLTQNIPVVFIGSSFIGMVSAQQINNYLGIAIAGIIFCVIYLNTSLFFNGYGGALGTSACISILVVLAIPYFKSKRHLTVGFLQLRRLVLKRKR